MLTKIYQLPIKTTLFTSWDKVRGSLKPFWAAIGITILIGFGIGFLSGLLSNYSTLASTLLNLIGQIVTTLLQMGLLYIGILRAKDAPIQYKQIFRSFEKAIALRILGVYAIQFLIFLPVTLVFVLLPIIAAGGNIDNIVSSGLTLGSFLIIAWFCLGVLVGLYLTLRMTLSMGLVVDKGTNAWAAIKLSFQATRCNEWRLFVLLLCQLTIVIIGAIPLMIGLIWSIPFILIIYGMAYQRLQVNLNAQKPL